MVKYSIPSKLFPYLYIADSLYVKNVEYTPFNAPSYLYFDYAGTEISIDPKNEDIYIQYRQAEGTLSYNQDTDSYEFSIEQLLDSEEDEATTEKIFYVAKTIMKALVQLEMMSTYNMETILSQKKKIRVVS